MLYKFKSKTTGTVIMLQPNGQQVLEIIGKNSPNEPSVQGILLPEQMAAALESLESAVAYEEAARKEAIEQAHAQTQVEHLPEQHAQAISLRQRALPFMEMVRQCMKDNVPITWGV